MKIKIKRDDILKGIQKTQGIVEKKGTMPILSNILIETGRESIDIIATDLEIGIKSSSPADVIEEGGITISARKTFEIMREIIGEDVLIEREENNWVKITDGHSEFRIMGLAKEEFPSLPEPEESSIFSMDSALLSDMLRKTIYSSGESDTRYVLNGLLFLARQRPPGISLTMVGTDGHRLAIIDKSIESPTGLGEEKKIVIPKKTAVELKKLLDEIGGSVSIGLNKNHIIFKMGSTILLSRLIEGSYPNYEQVLASTRDKRISVDRILFLGALKRVSILSREKTNAVKLEIENDRILLTSNNPDIGEAKEVLEVSYKGDAMTIGFNARYLLDALTVMDGEKVRFDLHDPLSPTFLMEEGNEGYRCVVMPMRL